MRTLTSRRSAWSGGRGGGDERTREFLAQRINVWTPDRLWGERTKDLEPTVTSVTAPGASRLLPSGEGGGLTEGFIDGDTRATTTVVLPDAGIVIVSRAAAHVLYSLASGAPRGPAVPGRAVRRADGAVLIDIPNGVGAERPGNSPKGAVWWARTSPFVAVGADHETALPVWAGADQLTLGWREGSAPLVGIPTAGGAPAAYSSRDGSLLWRASGGPVGGWSDRGPSGIDLVTPVAAFVLAGIQLCSLDVGSGSVESCRVVGPRVCALRPSDGVTLWCRDVSDGDVRVVGWDGARIVLRIIASISSIVTVVGVNDGALLHAPVQGAASTLPGGGALLQYASPDQPRASNDYPGSWHWTSGEIFPADGGAGMAVPGMAGALIPTLGRGSSSALILTENDAVTAYSSAGTRSWTLPADPGLATFWPLIVTPLGLLESADNSLQLRDLSTGALRWEVSEPTSFIEEVLGSDGKRIVVVRRQSVQDVRDLAAIDGATGKTLWSIAVAPDQLVATAGGRLVLVSPTSIRGLEPTRP